uniref:Phospholipid/glycerol acyltransferase domain-containing protein n=1 Tax=Aegilops tauschii TaxID=37682 RepID=M8CXP9_AEGTA
MGAPAQRSLPEKENTLSQSALEANELYVVSWESAKTARLPRERYPKPLIFHDGRLAFLPTAPAMLAFFLFLPLGFILSVIRISIGIVLPYNISFAASALAGVCFRTSGRRVQEAGAKRRGVLFVCTHRTLVDPIMLTAALQKPVPAVTGKPVAVAGGVREGSSYPFRPKGRSSVAAAGRRCGGNGREGDAGWEKERQHFYSAVV